jgi:drug/metabolite transporter (DMT)-like permease
MARGAGLGLAAALAFGGFLLWLGEASESTVPAAVLCGRLASVGTLGLLLAARGGSRAPQGRDAVAVVALGGLDVLANLSYAGAAAAGSDAVVAVLGSLYPLTTVLLARALLAERLGRARSAGIAAVLGGVALISLSG